MKTILLPFTQSSLFFAIFTVSHRADQGQNDPGPTYSSSFFFFFFFFSDLSFFSFFSFFFFFSDFSASTSIPEPESASSSFLGVDGAG